MGCCCCLCNRQHDAAADGRGLSRLSDVNCGLRPPLAAAAACLLACCALAFASAPWAQLSFSLLLLHPRLYLPPSPLTPPTISPSTSRLLLLLLLLLGVVLSHPPSRQMGLQCESIRAQYNILDASPRFHTAVTRVADTQNKKQNKWETTMTLFCTSQ
jgi:hypothetical protein